MCLRFNIHRSRSALLLALAVFATMMATAKIIPYLASNAGWLGISSTVNQVGNSELLDCVLPASERPASTISEAIFSRFEQLNRSADINDSQRAGLVVSAQLAGHPGRFLAQGLGDMPMRGELGALQIGCAYWHDRQPDLALKVWRTGGERLANYFGHRAFTYPDRSQELLLTLAVQIAPESFVQRYRYGAWLVSQHAVQSAVDLYQEAYRDSFEANRTLSIDQTLAALEAGGLLIKLGEYQKAFDLLSLLLDRGTFDSPDNRAWAHHQRARSAFPLQLETQAFADLARAVELDPSNVEHLIAWGQLLTRSGRENEAIAQFDQAIQRSTAPEKTIASIALRLIWEGKYALAVDYYDRLGAPETVDVQGWKGFALARVGDTAQAELLLVSATASEAAQPEWYEVYADMLLAQGRNTDALHVYQRLLQIAPDNAAARQYLDMDQIHQP